MPVAFITGANRGLGLEFTRQYLADGWHVFATCRDPAAANELQRLAEKARGKLAIIAMDVTDAQSVRAAAAQVGDVGIDLLLNCAGITGIPGQKVGGRRRFFWKRSSRCIRKPMANPASSAIARPAGR